MYGGLCSLAFDFYCYAVKIICAFYCIKLEKCKRVFTRFQRRVNHACVCLCMHETDLSVCALHPQENVSLADILCLRDGGLSEQELWAVCVECVRSLQSIGLSPLFHTLCVTPDTLAFNAHGNVCFMEQLNGESAAA